MAALQISPISDIFSYVSAPTSPGRGCNTLKGNHNFLFLSVPTSPTRQLSRASSGLESLPITPETDEGFAFHTDQRFFRGERGSDAEYSYQPNLKLPPRLQPAGDRSNTNNCRICSRSKPGSAASSPGSRSSRFNNPFSRKTVGKTGFDPFMAAFEKIKEGKAGKNVKGSYQQQHRKSFSLSVSPVFKKGTPLLWPSKSAKWDLVSSPKNKPFEKKWGFDFGLDSKQTSREGGVRAVKKGREPEKSGVTKEIRRQRIKRFLFNNASFGRKVDEEKREHKVSMLGKQRTSRECSIKEAKVTNRQSSSNVMVKFTREIKSLIKYRPRILSCSSFGSKGGARTIQA